MYVKTSGYKEGNEIVYIYSYKHIKYYLHRITNAFGRTKIFLFKYYAINSLLGTLIVSLWNYVHFKRYSSKCQWKKLGGRGSALMVTSMGLLSHIISNTDLKDLYRPQRVCSPTLALFQIKYLGPERLSKAI